MGPYCDFCDQRCFVDRVLRGGDRMLLATCPAGAAHDRKVCGEDHQTAVNPYTQLAPAAAPPRVHELKTSPESFAAITAGSKRVDLRLDDRDYRAGDKLVLDEFDPATGPTGRFVVRWVTHVQLGDQFGLAQGYVALSLSDHCVAGVGAGGR